METFKARLNLMMPLFLNACRNKIDLAVTYAILGNIASLIFGPITAYIIATRFSPEIQGYYYTFGSLVMVQFLLDLGIGQVIVQFASHEWANLSLDPSGKIIGEKDSLLRLISLVYLSCKWYLIAAIILLLGLTPAGYFFFTAAPKTEIKWALPWIFLCIGISIQFVLMPIFYLLQGCNQVTSFWFYRLFQRIINDLTLWIAIVCGAKLWASPISVYLTIIWSLLFLVGKYRPFISSFLNHNPGSKKINWKAEIWPVQWRMAVSWMGAYLTTSIFSPILFHLLGPTTAGKFGMTVSLNNILHAISINWGLTKAPYFGILISKKEYKKLDTLYSNSFVISLFVSFIGAIGIWLIVFVLNYIDHPIAGRILSPFPLSFILIGTVFNSMTTNISIYLRAHKKEPLYFVYIISAFIIALSTLSLGKYLGEVGVAVVYMAIIVLIQFPLALALFYHFRKQWHC